jgi:hypothetical protein
MSDQPYREPVPVPPRYRTITVPSNMRGYPRIMEITVEIGPDERIVSVYPVYNTPGRYVGDYHSITLEALIERIGPAHV